MVQAKDRSRAQRYKSHSSILPPGRLLARARSAMNPVDVEGSLALSCAPAVGDSSLTRGTRLR
jgi:hypothetical protein